MPTITEKFDAVLFDMDGTLVDSTKGVVGAWNSFAKTYPFLDVHEILNTSHGVRTVDNLRVHCGITDPVKLEEEAVRFEEEIVNTSRVNGQEGIVLLPGVKEIITSLGKAPEAAPQHWAICTSATRKYATAALGITGIPIPKAFVTAEDVERGKPHPDPYLLGAKLVGAQPEKCLVVEDAPAGIASGRTAGCKTLAVVTSHSRQTMEMSEPTYLVPNLASVNMQWLEDGIEVTIHLD